MSSIAKSPAVPPGKLGTALIIDGDPDTRLILTTYLDSHGYAVTEADTALGALASVLIARPSVIVSELVVPGPNGARMLDLLAWAAPARKTATIIFTTDVRPQARERVERMGAAFLAKPAGPRDVLDEIRRRSQPSPARPSPGVRGLAIAAMCLVLPLAGCGPREAPEVLTADPRIAIPASLRAEHEEIHHALLDATRAAEPVGAAARELEAVLRPHFEREEQIALPPLGLLAPLASGAYADGMRAVLPLSDSLAAELPAMLREHGAIGAAAARLEEVARAAHDTEVERLARQLQAHARAEEETYYPAAVLVGEVVRARGEKP